MGTNYLCGCYSRNTGQELKKDRGEKENPRKSAILRNLSMWNIGAQPC